MNVAEIESGAVTTNVQLLTPGAHGAPNPAKTDPASGLAPIVNVVPTSTRRVHVALPCKSARLQVVLDPSCTCPAPSPVRLTVTATCARVKLADTEREVLIVRVHGSAPGQSPPSPPNVAPSAGVPLTETTRPISTNCEQVALFCPSVSVHAFAPFTSTDPAPAPESDSVSVT